ncbi:precursor of elicitor peptide 1 [Raphanus sativus]|uniref:Precursor of elicitor peptide 1 n=1 Tax=Raphanus sativus TaxID=3726 RepID=A0A6J0NT54_RAPSA|nr:precursor of elicitor peptide 1 [Raphanus sativus]
MEEERRSEEESSHLWNPFHFFNEAIKSFLKCLGLHISPSPSASSEAPNGEVTTRGMIVRSKQRGRETPSSGRPGRHN